jgi:hypothetical protein
MTVPPFIVKAAIIIAYSRHRREANRQVLPARRPDRNITFTRGDTLKGTIRTVKLTDHRNRYLGQIIDVALTDGASGCTHWRRVEALRRTTDPHQTFDLTIRRGVRRRCINNRAIHSGVFRDTLRGLP